MNFFSTNFLYILLLISLIHLPAISAQTQDNKSSKSTADSSVDTKNDKEESYLEKLKSGSQKLWNKTKETAVDINESENMESVRSGVKTTQNYINQ